MDLNNRNKNVDQVPVPKTGQDRILIGGASNTSGSSLNLIKVNLNQKGNPLIGYIRNVGWEYTELNCDYQVGATTGLLYLSLRYHLLHPTYIHNRITKLGRSTYSLRLLLIHCDVDNHSTPIKELTKIAIINELTIIIAFSNQECARYLEIYKNFEKKPPTLIKQRVEDDFFSYLTSAFTTVKGINKTDVITLSTNFGSFKNIIQTSSANLVDCPGLGEKKVKRLRETFSGSFLVNQSTKKKKIVAEEKGENGPDLN